MASVESVPAQSRRLHTVLSSVGGFSQPDNKRIHSLEDLLRYVQTLGLEKYDGSQLETHAFLGEGVSYTVFKCTDKKTQGVFAVKKIKLPSSSSNFQAFEHRVSCVLRDIEVMNHGPLARHENILRLWGYGWDYQKKDPIPFLVTELAHEGTLREYLLSNHISKDTKLRLCGQVIAGLYEMHLCGVAHSDLKLDNVLVVKKGVGGPIVAKVSDFGHSIVLSSDNTSVKEYRGTVGYVPPEVSLPDVENRVIDIRKCDLWTLGLVCWEIILDGHPYYEDTAVQEAMNLFTSLNCTSGLSGTALGSDGSSQIESKLKVSLQIGGQLSSIAQRSVDRVFTTWPNPYQKSMCFDFFGDLLCEDPIKRTAKSIHVPLFFEYSVPRSTAPRQQLVKRTASEVSWTFESFKPSRLAGTPTSARAKIFQDFQTMTAHQVSLQAARASLHVGFAYAVGFGVKQDLQIFQRSAQESAARGLPIAKAICNLISNPQWNGRDTPTYSYTASVRNALRELIVKPKLGLINCNTYEELEKTSNHAAEATGSSAIPPTILAVFFRLTHEMPPTAQINDRDPATGETALAISCRLGDFEAVQNLMDRGADPSIRAKDGCLPLHWLFMFEDDKMDMVAARLTQEWYSQHLDCTTFSPRLLDSQFPLTLHGTPLAFAVATCSENAVKALLDQGADPISGLDKLDPDWGNMSALTIAACLHLDHLLVLLLEASIRLHRLFLPRPMLLSLLHAMSCASTVERRLIHGSRYQAAIENTAKILRGIPPRPLSTDSDTDIDVWVPLEAAVNVMDLAVAKALVHEYFLSRQEAKDQLFRICLEVACRGTLDWSQSLSILEFGLAQGCNINAVFPSGRAIDIVIARQNKAILHWLLVLRPDLSELKHANSDLSFSPLYTMIANGFSETVPIDLLLAGGAGPNSLSPAGDEGTIHLAIKHGMVKEVKALLDNRANPLFMNSEGVTGFFAAISLKKIQLVQLILPFIPDINVLDLNGRSALSLAVEMDLPDIAGLLLQRGATSESSSPTAIHRAAAFGNLKSLLVLIKAGVDLNPKIKPYYKDRDIATAKDTASMEHLNYAGNLDTTVVDPHPATKIEHEERDESTPLHLAIMSHTYDLGNAYECTMALLIAGADPNMKERDTERTEAADNIQVGDSVRTGMWPCHLIFRHFQGQQRLNLIMVLHRMGGRLDVTTNDGTTVLHLAAYMGDVPMVRYLLQSGMSPGLLGNHGQTALHDCVRSEYSGRREEQSKIVLANICEIATVLAEAGAGLPYKPYIRQAPRSKEDSKSEGDSHKGYKSVPKFARGFMESWDRMTEERAKRKRQEQEAFANRIEGYGIGLFRDNEHLTPLDFAASRRSDTTVLECLLDLGHKSTWPMSGHNSEQSGNDIWDGLVQSAWETAVQRSSWSAVQEFLIKKLPVDMNLVCWPVGKDLFRWAIERGDSHLLALFGIDSIGELPDHYPWPYVDFPDDFGVKLNFLWSRCLNWSVQFHSHRQNLGVRGIFSNLPGLAPGISVEGVHDDIAQYHRKPKIHKRASTDPLREIGLFVCSLDLQTAIFFFGAKFINRLIYLVGSSHRTRAEASQMASRSAAPGYTSMPLHLIYSVWSDPVFDQSRLSKLEVIQDSFSRMLHAAEGIWGGGLEQSISFFDRYNTWLTAMVNYEESKGQLSDFDMTDNGQDEPLPLMLVNTI